MTAPKKVKVYLVTRLTVSDYSFLALEKEHPIVVENRLSKDQMLCINKSDHDQAMSEKDKEIAELKKKFEITFNASLAKENTLKNVISESKYQSLTIRKLQAENEKLREQRNMLVDESADDGMFGKSGNIKSRIKELDAEVAAVFKEIK